MPDRRSAVNFSMEQPHIVILNHEFPPIGGGAATACRQLARCLARRTRVTVVTAAYGGLPRRDEADGYAIIRIPALRRYAYKSNPLEMVTFLLSSLWWAARHGRALGADACIAFFAIPAGPAAWLLRCLAGTPYLISARGGDVPGFLPEILRNWHRLTGRLIRALWRRASVVVTVSKDLERLVHESAPDQPTTVIPNCVDTAVFHPAASSADNPEPVLLFVGRLDRHKNLFDLLDALAMVADLPWRLTILGDGPLRSELQAGAVARGLADRVNFVGWATREQMPDWYQRADILVFPTLQEGFSNVQIEAMACALPVIIYDIDGCPLVRQGVTGLRVRRGDPAAFAAGVRRLLEDASLRRRLGQAGQELVLTVYDWNVAAEQYFVLCREAVAGARP
jgi:glycosyltransferase involved in cell wall biosynthesis